MKRVRILADNDAQIRSRRVCSIIANNPQYKPPTGYGQIKPVVWEHDYPSADDESSDDGSIDDDSSSISPIAFINPRPEDIMDETKSHMFKEGVKDSGIFRLVQFAWLYAHRYWLTIEEYYEYDSWSEPESFREEIENGAMFYYKRLLLGDQPITFYEHKEAKTLLPYALVGIRAYYEQNIHRVIKHFLPKKEQAKFQAIVKQWLTHRVAPPFLPSYGGNFSQALFSRALTGRFPTTSSLSHNRMTASVLRSHSAQERTPRAGAGGPPPGECASDDGTVCAPA